MSSNYFDELEQAAPEDREAVLFTNLPAYLSSAVASCPGLAKHLDGIETSTVVDRQSLESLPVLYKSALMEAQQADPPFGGFLNVEAFRHSPVQQGTRIFMSPGPVWEPQPIGADPWQSARSLYAAGIRAGDKVHNAFSYHMTPGGFILDEGALALGCQVFPAGVGNTEAQVEAAAFYQPDAYIGTPDYLKVLLDKAIEMGKPLESINKALVSGGALFPKMRAEYLERGVTVLQAYATADLGVIAYESLHDGAVGDGLICSENLIVEIVRPGTGDPVAVGEVGELVVTNFNKAYPLVRFATGDLSCLLPGTSDCGRTNMRLKGWMGRADQRTKVKGMFVDPKQVYTLVKSQAGISKARLVVSRSGDSDALLLRVEGEGIDTSALEASMQQILKLRGTVEHSKEALPNDGVVISDEREYEKG